MTALGLGLGLPFGGRISNPLASLGAVFAIDARNSFSGEQAAVNFGTGGSALNAQYGSTTGVDTNDPLLLTHTGSNYIYLPGTAGNYASSPDAAVLDLSSALEIVIRAQPVDWSPTSETIIIGKRDSGTTTSYQLSFNSTNTILRLSFNGTDLINLSSSNVPLADNVPGWVKASWRNSDGAWSIEYAADSSTEPTSWTSLGSGTSSAGSTLYSSSSLIEIGSQGANTSGFFTGRIYRTIIRSSVGGTTVFDADFSRNSAQNSFSEFSSNAATVTVNRSTSGRKSVMVVRPVWLFGTDDYLEVANNALLNVGTNEAFTVMAVTRSHGNTSNMALIGKGGYGTTDWYALVESTAPTAFQGGMSNSSGISGIYYSNVRAAPPAAGTVRFAATGRSASGGGVYTYDGNASQTPNFTSGAFATTDIPTTAVFRIGSFIGAGGGPAGPIACEIMAAAFFRKALTAGEIAQIVSYYGTA